MAIQHRRGIYDKFDPTRLVAGEWAIVLSGDPVAEDGMAAYICFAAGVVKRVATYEDMADFLASVKVETVDWIVNTANAGFKEEYAHVRDDAMAAENERKAAESKRKIAEDERIAAETARDTAEKLRAAAAAEHVTLIADFEQKVDEGFFNGATFVPEVSEDGLVSWTNDKGLPNPITRDIRGPKGNDGVVTQLAAGMFALQIEGTDLYVIYGEETEPPNLSIEDECLYIEIGA